MKLKLPEFYKLLVRPTVVITTISRNKLPNAAPFSWNSPMATSPKPLFGFSSSVKHDTWRNIKENNEFVVNLVGEDFGPLMAIMETNFPYEVNEITECELTEMASTHVKPPRIKEAFGWFECRMITYQPLFERNVWIIGEVLTAEIQDQAYDEVVNVEKVKPLNHIWGEAFMTTMKITKFRRA